ncbi:hypothetical protein P7C71_g6010, partial [Lecanoromycetidae sp. Uapishka_2]
MHITDLDAAVEAIVPSILKYQKSLQTLSYHASMHRTSRRRKLPYAWTTAQLDELRQESPDLSHLEVDFPLEDGKWPGEYANALARFNHLRTLKIFVELRENSSDFAEGYHQDAIGSVPTPSFNERLGREVTSNLFASFFVNDAYSRLTDMEVTFTREEIYDRALQIQCPTTTPTAAVVVTEAATETKAVGVEVTALEAAMNMEKGVNKNMEKDAKSSTVVEDVKNSTAADKEEATVVVDKMNTVEVKEAAMAAVGKSNMAVDKAEAMVEAAKKNMVEVVKNNTATTNKEEETTTLSAAAPNIIAPVAKAPTTPPLMMNLAPPSTTPNNTPMAAATLPCSQAH